jgi:hydrogenase expression/formation protein HypC
MCLAIPAKVLKKSGAIASVDFGDGVTREVNISLVEVDKGEYVIVHAGFAIQRIDEKEAKKTLELWNEMLTMEGKIS